MAFYKNVASQKVAVYARNMITGAAKTGDAANITAHISKDGGACAATDDVHPTELDATNAKGFYLFDSLQAETNADLLVITPVSATDDIELDPVVIYPEPAMRECNAIQISGDATAADDLELLVENAKGADHKVLVSTDAQDLSGTLDVNAKTVTDGAISESTFDADLDVYSLALDFDKDDSNSVDRYGARILKNGVVLTAGVTLAKITVWEPSGPTTLINAESLTDGGSHKYSYTASTSERITLGLLYFVTVTATIGGSSRTLVEYVKRDSPG